MRTSLRGAAVLAAVLGLLSACSPSAPAPFAAPTLAEPIELLPCGSGSAVGPVADPLRDPDPRRALVRYLANNVDDPLRAEPGPHEAALARADWQPSRSPTRDGEPPQREFVVRHDGEIVARAVVRRDGDAWATWYYTYCNAVGRLAPTPRP